MQGFYNITEQIRLQLSQDEFVNTVTYGDIFRIDLKKQTIFPLSHVVVNNATIETNIVRYSMSVMAMDIVDISNDPIDNNAIGKFRGNDNEQDVLNTQQAVLMRLLKVLQGGTLYESLYQLDGNPTLETFTERFENYLAGWVATFDVLIPNNMTACSGATVPSCADATYLVEYANGTLIEQGTVESGGSVTVTVPNPATCDDATLNINGSLFTTIGSGDTYPLIVHNSLGDSYPIGAAAGLHWGVGDSQIRINGTLTNSLPAQVPLDITGYNSNLDVVGTPSGTDIILIADSVVSNSDDTYLVNVPAEQPLELPDTTYNFVVNGTPTSATIPSIKDETFNIVWL